MLTPWSWPVRVWEAFNPPDNIQNGGRPAGSASRARTGWDLAAVTRVDLLCVSVLCQGVNASVYTTCRGRIMTKSAYAENDGDGLLYSILSHEVSWF